MSACSFCGSAPAEEPYTLCTFCCENVPMCAFEDGDRPLTVAGFYQRLAVYHHTARITGADIAKAINLKVFGEDNA